MKLSKNTKLNLKAFRFLKDLSAMFPGQKSIPHYLIPDEMILRARKEIQNINDQY